MGLGIGLSLVEIRRGWLSDVISMDYSFNDVDFILLEEVS
jgi:hypothetical protein